MDKNLLKLCDFFKIFILLQCDKYQKKEEYNGLFPIFIYKRQYLMYLFDLK